LSNLDHLDLIKEALAFAAPDEVFQEFSASSTLSELGISSITALEMAGYIEEKLGIVFPDDELSQVNTLNDFDQLIRRHISPTRTES
jgi:acyl carrier protein